jgi:hypothetical protein
VTPRPAVMPQFNALADLQQRTPKRSRTRLPVQPAQYLLALETDAPMPLARVDLAPCDLDPSAIIRLANGEMKQA